MYRKKDILTNQEKILLSRIYKLDRQIQTFMAHHKNESMNKLLPQTNFIKKAYDIYNAMPEKLINISLMKTKHTQNLVDISKLVKDER